MKYTFTLNLSDGWKVSYDTLIEEDGNKSLYAEATGSDGSTIEIYLADMPEDSDPSDQALANFVDMVGFDPDDPWDYSPIMQWAFNGKVAYGFEALCDDDLPMRLICVEPKKGILAVANIIASDEDSIEKVFASLEKGLRIKTAK